MSGPDDCPCGHPLNENYRCIAGWYYGPCPHPDCGGVCESQGECASPDCACRDDEESEPVTDLTFAAMLELANAARAEVDAERDKLATAFTAMAVAAGLTVVRTDPFEEAVVHPGTLAVLRRMVEPGDDRSRTVWGGQIGRLDVPTVPVLTDVSVPPGEIHMRPCGWQESQL